MNADHFHPLSVHFPIALLLVGFFLDVISLIFKKEKCLSRAGFYLMILGTLGAVAAYFTGEFFSKEMAGNTFFTDKKETHELFAKTTMFIMLAASALRIFMVIKKKETGILKWIVFVLFFAGCLFVAYTGLLGGKIEYEVIPSIISIN
jgi:uncharacterized membrane protein